MTEADIQAVEARVLPERETTQAIARRVLTDPYTGEEFSPDDVVRTIVYDLINHSGWTEAEIPQADLAEILRRAAAGECDPEPR